MTGSIFALVVVAIVAVALIRGVEVRLVLSLAGLALFVWAGRSTDFLGVLVRELANPRTVVPIGAALGFARVLAVTGCDKHLVHLMISPIRKARGLMVPGGIAVGYLVNTAIVSQTGAAAAVGPILFPLLVAAGFSSETSGAILLLGSSMGGELFNEGAVEIATLASLTNLSPRTVVARVAPLNLIACSVALAVAWALLGRSEKKRATVEVQEPIAPFRVNLFKAIVPFLPLALLFASNRFVLPEALRPGPARILAAMLIGTFASGLADRSRVNALGSAFFEGAGYAYTHVISLIVTATAFADGLTACGLVNSLTSVLTRLPRSVALIVAVLAPWALATISGTGIAPAVAALKTLIPHAEIFGLEPARLGALAALGAHFGRTTSPVAAVVLYCSTLTGAKPARIIRLVVLPLVAGAIALLIAARRV